MKSIALLSMLHEPASAHSALRRFRNEPVLAWTLRRLARSRRLSGIAVAAWDDQREALASVCDPGIVRRQGNRKSMPALDAVTIARKWSDGWRGGLLSTCAYDRGFVASVVLGVFEEHQVEAVLLIDPSSALVDPAILDRLIETAEAGTRDYYFTQAPPGLAGVLLKRSMAQRLSESKTHPGRIVHYLPDAPVLDPVTSDACVALPLAVSRSTHNFLMDSDRQIQRLTEATEPLNGALIASDAEQLMQRLGDAARSDAYPRDITIELTPRRQSRPIFAPATSLDISRADLPAEWFEKIVAEAAGWDDARICLAGTGDPLLHLRAAEILNRCAPLHAVSLESDLLKIGDSIMQAIVQSNVDVVSVHLPAMNPRTYARVMGVDAMTEAVENIRRLLVMRQSAGRTTPLIVPTFMKLAENIEEMENWYDTWLRAVGSAVIAGPSDYAGQIPDRAVADMTPPLRKACARIQSRLTILSDGSIVMCEQDVLGRHPLGNIATDSIAEVWRRAMTPIRSAHAVGTSLPVLCGSCREWHRP